MTSLLYDITVNGVTIPAARIAAEAQMHPAPKGKPGLAWRAAARALALREAMLQEARARHLSPSPHECAPGLMETDEEALIRQLLDFAVTPAPIDEDALQEYYDADPDRFRAPPLWEAAHILFAAPPDDEEARLQTKMAASAALSDIRTGRARWDEVARRESACSSRENAGRLGQIGPGDTVAPFEAALRKMAEGEIAGPVETAFGHHLIRLDAVAQGAVLPFSAALPRLLAAAEKAAWVRASHEFATALLARAEVTGLASDAVWRDER
jgi:peptidyl-prolyl cis-trans isomerase C